MKLSRNYRVFATIAMLMWASSYATNKIAFNSFTPIPLGAFRYTEGAVILCCIGAFRRIGLPKKRDVPWFLLAGFVGFTLYTFAYQIGVRLNTASVTSVVAATSPIITSLLATIVFREKLSLLCWLAIAVEFIGIIVLNITDTGFQFSVGIILILASATLFSVYSLLLRRFAGVYSSLQVATYSLTAGAIFLIGFLPRAFGELAGAPAEVVASALYIGLGPSAVAYLCWSRALALAPSSGAATNYQFLTPVAAVFISFALIGEVPSARTIAGLLIVVGGLFAFNYFSRRPQFGRRNERGCGRASHAPTEQK